MKFLAPLLMLAASAIAAPVASATKNFHLKSSGASNPDHNDLYVYAYHTGAGLNDAVLTKDVGTASPVYLNGTNALFDLQSELSWGVVAIGNTNYASWEPIQINAGRGSSGFSVKGNDFQWSEASGFGGWLGRISPRNFLHRAIANISQCATGTTMRLSCSTCTNTMTPRSPPAAARSR
jgi:hypothetical protein